MLNKPKKVYVAMSGGVDSSVAVALLKKRGFDVIGVFFKPWQPFQGGTLKKSQGSTLETFCNWQKDRQDALAVASVLGIPFKTWDFSREYKEKVGDYMVETYRQGQTPNPDVMCNKEIKFGLFLKKALAEGADYIATGHYIRLKPEMTNAKLQMTNKIQNSKSKKIFSLLKGKDRNKDQSYFLWALTQQQLKYCLFPIGDYLKPEVRKLAKKFGLPTHNKKDSQGVCFIGQLDMKEFLKSYIKPKTGEIQLINQGRTLKKSQGSTLKTSQKVVGKHEGTSYYTIGQRHGLNINNGQGPYYVVAKDIKKNIVYVGEEKDLETDKAKVDSINWINKNVKLPLGVAVKVRYRTKEQKAVLYKNGTLEFKNPVRAVTPGQSAVFYKGEEMLGGGIILSI